MKGLDLSATVWLVFPRFLPAHLFHRVSSFGSLTERAFAIGIPA